MILEIFTKLKGTFKLNVCSMQTRCHIEQLINEYAIETSKYYKCLMRILKS